MPGTTPYIQEKIISGSMEKTVTLPPMGISHRVR